MDRREFIRQGTLVTAGLTLLSSGSLFTASAEKVRLGFIGVGLRGRSHVGEALLRSDVDVVAICDTQESSLQYCRQQFQKANKLLPKEYTGGIDAYKGL